MAIRTASLLYVGLVLCLAKLGVCELFVNPDFEDAGGVTTGWKCQGNCILTASNDTYSGNNSVKISGRSATWKGLAQDVSLTPGSMYNFTAYIKLLNLPTGAFYETVVPKLKCDLSDGTKLVYPWCKSLYVFPNEWTEIGGIHTLEAGATNCKIYIQTNTASVNYLIDATSLQLIPSNPQWKAEANARIEQIRKSNITVNVTGVTTDQIDVEIKQTKHEFAFGAAVGAEEFVDPALENYTKTFYDNFEWAVLHNALKWKLIEKTYGDINLERPLNAINALRANGIPIRGHNVFWGVEGHLPTWLETQSAQNISDLIQYRTNYIIGNTTGLLEHWDVNNENLHGDWFEQKLSNPNITMQMFRDIHAVDPNVKLFLNDYGVMALGMAVPIMLQAKRFKDSGVPIYGIGIQSHMKSIDFDPYEFKLKLDIVAQAGVPIWITELTVNSTDANLKASRLDDLLTLYFSYPAIEGVMLWGYWDGRMGEPVNALFEGPYVTPNAAGIRYHELVQSIWRTNVAQSIQDNSSFSVRGFKGTYTVNVKRNGQVVKNETFTLSDGERFLGIDVGPATPTIVIG